VRLLVTGATGFLGRRVVADALRRGHTVRAMVRPGFDGASLPPQVEIIRADLRDPHSIDVAGVDAVLHLAAAKTGDLYSQMHTTVVGTENLIAANKNIGTTHITNGCYRLHPVEWNIGESAGLLAAHCLDEGIEPRAVRADEGRLAAFQSLLESEGVELDWPQLHAM